MRELCILILCLMLPLPDVVLAIAGYATGMLLTVDLAMD